MTYSALRSIRGCVTAGVFSAHRRSKGVGSSLDSGLLLYPAGDTWWTSRGECELQRPLRDCNWPELRSQRSEKVEVKRIREVGKRKEKGRERVQGTTAPGCARGSVFERWTNCWPMEGNWVLPMLKSATSWRWAGPQRLKLVPSLGSQRRNHWSGSWSFQDRRVHWVPMLRLPRAWTRPCLPSAHWVGEWIWRFLSGGPRAGIWSLLLLLCWKWFEEGCGFPPMSRQSSSMPQETPESRQAGMHPCGQVALAVPTGHGRDSLLKSLGDPLGTYCPGWCCKPGGPETSSWGDWTWWSHSQGKWSEQREGRLGWVKEKGEAPQTGILKLPAEAQEAPGLCGGARKEAHGW